VVTSVTLDIRLYTWTPDNMYSRLQWVRQTTGTPLINRQPTQNYQGRSDLHNAQSSVITRHLQLRTASPSVLLTAPRSTTCLTCLRYCKYNTINLTSSLKNTKGDHFHYSHNTDLFTKPQENSFHCLPVDDNDA